MPKKKSKKLKPSVNEIWKSSLLDYNYNYDPLFVYNLQVKPQYLVFEGGGVKGIAYVGALEKLEQNQMLNEVESVAGSSAGGITAFLLGTGHKPSEVKRIMSELDFKKFVEEKDRKWWDPAGLANKISGIHKLINSKTHGFSSGDNYRELIAKILVDKVQKTIDSKFNGNLQKLSGCFPNITDREINYDDIKNMTFSEFTAIKEEFPEFKFIDMKFTGTNITQENPVIFGAGEEELDFRIIDAVRITGSYPGMFAAVPVKNPATDEWDYYVDGGLCSNFPTEIYDNSDFLPDGYNFTRTGGNPALLGFLIDSAEEIQRKIWHQSVKSKSKKHGILKYIGSLISGMQINRSAIDRHGPRIIQIDDQGISTLKFDISDEEVNTLVESGKKSASKWIKNYKSSPVYDFQYYNTLEGKYQGLSESETEDCYKMMLDVYEKLEKELLSKKKGSVNNLIKELSQVGFENELDNLGKASSLSKHLNTLDIKDKQAIQRIIDLFNRDPTLKRKLRDIGKIEKRMLQVENEIGAIYRCNPIISTHPVAIRLEKERKKIIQRKVSAYVKNRNILGERRKQLSSEITSPKAINQKGFISQLKNALKDGMAYEYEHIISECKANVNKLQELINVNQEAINLHEDYTRSLKKDLLILAEKRTAIKNAKELRAKYKAKADRIRREEQLPEDKLRKNLKELEKELNEVRKAFYKYVDSKSASKRTQNFNKKFNEDFNNKNLELLSAQDNWEEYNEQFYVLKDMKISREIKDKEDLLYEIEKNVNNLNREKDNSIKKKYAFKKQIRIYQTATDIDSIIFIKRLIDLDKELSNYIDKKSNRLTKFLGRFCTENSKIRKFSPFGIAYYVHKAREQQHAIQQVLQGIEKDWSIEKNINYEEIYKINANISRDVLIKNKSIFWGDSHNELLSILDKAVAPNLQDAKNINWQKPKSP